MHLPEECCRQESWDTASSLTRLDDLIEMGRLDPALQWWKMGILWRRWGSSKLRTAWPTAWWIRRNGSRRKYINSGMCEAVCNVSDNVGLTGYITTEINCLGNIRAMLSRISSMIYFILPLIGAKIITACRSVKFLRLIMYSVLSHDNLETVLKHSPVDLLLLFLKTKISPLNDHHVLFIIKQFLPSVKSARSARFLYGYELLSANRTNL
jgi:hypothetical protein